MTAQPVHPHEPEPPPRVPRTINGIADALTGARRMEFYRAVGDAEAGPQLQHVLDTWWDLVMLEADPAQEQAVTAVEAGTLSKVGMAEVIRRRRFGVAAMPGEH